MPPFDGPRATLCVTRYPCNTWVLPSSIETGTETASAFLHSWRTLTRFGSIPKVSATLLSCDLAISKGFSRRCETGASTVVTSAPFSAQMGTFLAGPGRRSLLDCETDRPGRRRSRIGRERHQPQLIIAAREHGACRVATGHPERIATRKNVAQARKQSDATAVGTPQLEIEAGQRKHVRLAGRTEARTGGRRFPKVITQGTRISRPAAGVTITTPSAGAVPTSLLVTLARTWTRIDLPGPSEECCGLRSKRSAAAPSWATRTSSERIRRRKETLRRTNSCSVRQLGLSARPNASEAGLAPTSVAVAPPMSINPTPWAVTRSSGSGRAEPTSRLFSASASR